jgi:hypothetical protein
MVDAENRPERRRLPGAIGTEEGGDTAWLGGERHRMSSTVTPSMTFVAFSTTMAAARRSLAGTGDCPVVVGMVGWSVKLMLGAGGSSSRWPIDALEVPEPGEPVERPAHDVTGPLEDEPAGFGVVRCQWRRPQ